jgi:hypothetical protein
MQEVEILEQRLRAAQNSDGGWSYHGGAKSWTEPTAMSILALSARGRTDAELNRARRWLIERQRADGGWAPNPVVDTSTWVTSVAVLALQRAGWPMKLKPASARTTQGGTPWYPGTAAWIGPTVFSVLALRSLCENTSDCRIQEFIEASRNYLLSRRCKDGGWNHGGSRYRSENSRSYPEMTGLALLAFPPNPGQWLAKSLARAQEHLAAPESMQGLCWLQVGLAYHNVAIADVSDSLPCRTNEDVWLRLLALRAKRGEHRLDDE